MHWELIERCWLPVDERPRVGGVVSSLKHFLDSCSPTQPLRDFLRVTSDSTIEPGMIPRATRASDRDADPLNPNYASDIKRLRVIE